MKAIPMGLTKRLTFAWWNLHNFAHYDAEKIALPRWPKQRAHYEAKRGRALDVLRETTGDQFPDILAVCEITREAALDLVKAMPAGFDIAIAPPNPVEDVFQVAVFYRRDANLTPELPLLPSATEDVTRKTRPMVTVHLTLPGHVIRFVACHWTSSNKASSRRARNRLADFLRRDTYRFLFPSAPDPTIARHVLIVGDLNVEPMADLFRENLECSRDRKSSRDPHQTDADVRRVRLYNLAWRYLGEQVPHGMGQSQLGGAAGTCYCKIEDELRWMTFDHVLVSGDLLGESQPYLDEVNTRIVSIPILQDKHGLPIPFEPGSQNGVSDHLPIVGQLILPETSR